jgi:hypothetical protein
MLDTSAVGVTTAATTGVIESCRKEMLKMLQVPMTENEVVDAMKGQWSISSSTTRFGEILQEKLIVACGQRPSKFT